MYQKVSKRLRKDLPFYELLEEDIFMYISENQISKR